VKAHPPSVPANAQAQQTHQTQPGAPAYPVLPKGKKACFFFNQGVCDRGASCPYVHVIDRDIQLQLAEHRDKKSWSKKGRGTPQGD